MPKGVRSDGQRSPLRGRPRPVSVREKIRIGVTNSFLPKPDPPTHCEDCGIPRVRLHRHHVVPKSQGGSNSPSNIVHICANCHEDRHRVPGMEPWLNSQLPAANAKRSASLRAYWDGPDGARRCAERSRNTKLAHARRRV